MNVVLISVIVIAIAIVAVCLIRRQTLSKISPEHEEPTKTIFCSDRQNSHKQEESEAVGNAPEETEIPQSAAAEEEDEEKTVTKNDQLVADLHHVFEEEKVFLRPDIHIDDVAKMLLTNRTYVTRLMRQEYGLSFIEYVNIARIQHSQSLLYSTHMTLDEVAERSGFQSTSNYCRAFKRYIGTTPLAWKNSLPKVKE